MTNDLGHRASSPYRRGAADGARVERDDPIAMIRLAAMAAAFQAMSASLIAQLYGILLAAIGVGTVGGSLMIAMAEGRTRT